MFELTGSPIVPHVIPSLHPHAGGVVSFEGRVRALNDGRVVTALDYEVYMPLALSEGQAILDEALQRYGLLHAYAIHRYGHLRVGDMAVQVVTATMHRKEAFLATEYIIHEIKHRLPIWKKEWYDNGTSGWVRCTHAVSA